MVTPASLTHRILFYFFVNQGSKGAGELCHVHVESQFPRIKPVSLAMEAQNPDHWIFKEFQNLCFIEKLFQVYLDIHFCPMCLLCIQKTKKKGNWLRQSYTLFTCTIQFSFYQFPLELSIFPHTVTPCAIRRCCMSPSKPLTPILHVSIRRHGEPASKSPPPSHQSSYDLLADGATAQQNIYATSCVDD